MAYEILKVGRTIDMGSQGMMTEIVVRSGQMASSMFVNAESFESEHALRGDFIDIASDGTVKVCKKAEHIFNKMHHIAIIGSNLEKTRDFYVNKLGFKVLEECYRKEQDDYRLDLKQGDVRLEIFIKPDSPQRPSYPEANGLRHLCFHVSSVDETIRILNSLGIETEPVRNDTFTGEKLTFFHDPDGLPIEVHE